MDNSPRGWGVDIDPKILDVSPKEVERRNAAIEPNVSANEKEYFDRANRDLHGLDDTMALDRKWFKANAARDFCLRKATRHEEFMGVKGWVLVCQVEPGFRMRAPIPWPEGDFSFLLSDRDQELALGQIFQRITNHVTPGTTHPQLYALIEFLRAKLRRAFHAARRH